MAGGLWAKRFDKKNGETRECKGCGNQFHTMKPRWKCTDCINANQKIIETKRRALRPAKDKYPFDNKGTESNIRFHRIQKELRQAWKEYEETGDKSIVLAHYEKQLKEIKDNGIWEWIWDRRDDATKKANQLKTRNKIQTDYPDTRNYYED